MPKFQVGDRVELISRAHCSDVPIGARGSVAYIHYEPMVAPGNGRESIHVIWDSLKGTVFQDQEIEESIRVLTEEEKEQESRRQTTWYQAIKGFTKDEMLVFLEDLCDGVWGDVFCRAMCKHRDGVPCMVSRCPFTGNQYLSKFLESPMPDSEKEYMKRKVKEKTDGRENKGD